MDTIVRIGQPGVVASASESSFEWPVAVITGTRYGGVYEGGPWVAFGVGSSLLIPEEAFGGDPSSSDWWDAPTVPVGSGDSPNDAFAHLQFLVMRDASHRGDGYFAPDEIVRIARCTPDGWYAPGVGVVRSVSFWPTRPYSGGLRGQCTYEVDFGNGLVVRVPERYLRRGT